MMTMKLGPIVLALGIALGLAGGAQAASQHAHDGHGGTKMEMTLNNGQKWQTDEALRRGMGDIRTALAAALPRIHEGRFTAAEFSALADRVQTHVDDIVANCKLSEEADLQLHVALTHVLDGITAMKGRVGPEKGAVAILQALNAYGEYFDHPGWAKLGH